MFSSHHGSADLLYKFHLRKKIDHLTHNVSTKNICMYAF